MIIKHSFLSRDKSHCFCVLCVNNAAIDIDMIIKHSFLSRDKKHVADNVMDAIIGNQGISSVNIDINKVCCSMHTKILIIKIYLYFQYSFASFKIFIVDPQSWKYVCQKRYGANGITPNVFTYI